MRALTICEIGKVGFSERSEPELLPDHVLLDVTHVGLCGSDLATFRGLNPLVELPRIPGHEIAATILETGDAVPEKFAAGLNTIVVPYTECGRCSACKAGRTNACRFNKTLGVQQHGGMAERIAVHHSRIILNEDLSSQQRALVEPLSVGFHAVERSGLVAGETIVVLGAGMIGVGAIICALSRGARVLVVEVSKAKSALLKSLGVETIIDPTECDSVEEVHRLTNDDGADVVLEAVGLPVTFRNAVDMASFAGRVVYVGYAKEEVSYDTKFFNLKELNIFGSRNASRADFYAVIDWMKGNAHQADSLVSKVFDWSDAEQSLDYWESVRDKTFKVMIDMKGAQ